MPVDVQGAHAQAVTCLCWCGKRGEKTFLDLYIHIQTRDGSGRLLKLVKRGVTVARLIYTWCLSVHAQ